MESIKPLLPSNGHALPRTAIFLSGSGSNAEHLLMTLAEMQTPPLQMMALVTDAPETSRAKELGKKFGVPVIASDIRKFYSDHGESRVSLATPQGQELRKLWTDGLRKKLKKLELDFAVFAGFVPLTNLTNDFPCLNVHPGDLTYTVAGQRVLVGLHTLPIERAILAGLTSLRSSVIIAQTYTGKGSDMDNGPVLGISGEVPIDFKGFTVAQLLENQRHRPMIRPKGGFGDDLEAVAKANQTILKEKGDWVVLPKVVLDYAEGRFGVDENGTICYRIGETWKKVETVIYNANGQKEPVFI
ncbi:MAG: hypothetical protein J6T46_13520 [Victivallales bacterium]|nr:hypothetical protein [Victivallales bacterium]